MQKYLINHLHPTDDGGRSGGIIIIGGAIIGFGGY
jgi:hypothetical protein